MNATVNAGKDEERRKRKLRNYFVFSSSVAQVVWMYLLSRYMRYWRVLLETVVSLITPSSTASNALPSSFPCPCTPLPRNSESLRSASCIALPVARSAHRRTRRPSTLG